MTERSRFEPVVDENASADATAGCFRAIGLAIGTGLVAVLTAILGLWAITNLPLLSSLDYLPPEEAAGRIATAAFDQIGEAPALDPAPPAAVYPIGGGVDPVYAAVLERAFDLMRATDEGQRLFDVLVENDVHVFVESIAYNAGYTQTRWAWYGWVDSYIVIDTHSVRSRNLDALAAILIHEAVHADRSISGDACFYAETCDRLANGVALTEEVAAHAVEASFWMELYGDDGKRFAFGTDASQNQLLEAWLDGDDAFDRYVRRTRSDDREGTGL
jgi:hypothetical protein